MKPKNKDKDFLDEYITEREKKSPGFEKMVKELEKYYKKKLDKILKKSKKSKK